MQMAFSKVVSYLGKHLIINQAPSNFVCLLSKDHPYLAMCGRAIKLPALAINYAGHISCPLPETRWAGEWRVECIRMLSPIVISLVCNLVST